MRTPAIQFRMSNRLRVPVLVALFVAGALAPAQTQSPDAITSPRAAFGADIGADYFLATYRQLESYWKTLDAQSDRVMLVDIGRTEEGRTQWMAVVSAPENLARIDRYRDIARRLARAEGVSDGEARALAEEGKAVVWIDGGLHASEVLGAQQLIELVYQLASGGDAETARILRDVIVLAVHANPDGHDLVADWYMRAKDPRTRSLAGVPRPYQKYVGHDNNRDFYLSSQAETRNMNRVLYREWFPQIVYNHHQAGPAGTVMFAPPFRDPFNYVFDPLIPAGIDLVGAAMQARFAAEGKPGVTTRSGSTYSAWWNGGLRTTAYFHNQIGLLTETIGGPTPTAIPFVPERQLPSGDLPYPIAPQPWRFRQSIDYSMTANRAVLDFASRYRETLLVNVHRMGRNAIERGSRDSWTPAPRQVEAARADAGGSGAVAQAGSFERLFRDPRERDARGYILPSDQPDFLTALKFAGALLENGVTVHRATGAFTVQGKPYPAGSLVVKTAQAFRPHVLDMFEPQEHPHDLAYPGGPPIPPYDNAGWTLAFQMGVKFDRVLEGFDGPFEVLSASAPPAGAVHGEGAAAGFLVSHHQNDAFVAVNRLLRAGHDVYWPADRSGRWRARRDRHDVHPRGWRARRVAARPREGRGRSGAGVHRRGVAACGRAAQAAAGARRPVGSLRRLERERMDPVAVGTLRVPVRGGLPGDARHRRSRAPVRRPRAAHRRHPRERQRPRPVRTRRRAGRGSRPGRAHLVGPYHAAREAVRGAGRHAGADRRRGQDRRAARSRHLRRARRGRPRRRLVAAAAREALRAGIGAARGRGQHAAPRLRVRERSGRVLRRQPGVQARRARGR